MCIRDRSKGNIEARAVRILRELKEVLKKKEG